MANGGKRPGAGRPKGTPAASTIAKRDWGTAILPDAFEKILWRKFLKDKKNGFAAFQLALAYKHGKPVQPISGKDGGPIPVQLVTNAQLPNE